MPFAPSTRTLVIPACQGGANSHPAFAASSFADKSTTPHAQRSYPGDVIAHPRRPEHDGRPETVLATLLTPWGRFESLHSKPVRRRKQATSSPTSAWSKTIPPGL